MEGNISVRLVNNPGRIGILSGRVKTRGGRTRVEVIFPGNEKLFVLQNQIEAVSADEEPLDLLRKGHIGQSGDLRRNLTHIRLSGRLANLIYSMQTTHTDFYAHQFKPVLKLLDSPTNGLLIADEVGLGKTIEAGLIWTELRSRIDARRLLVLCPAMLREKWCEELRIRFGVEAETVNAQDLLDKLQQSSRQGDFGNFALIGSIQGLRPRRGWENLPEEENKGSATQLASFLDERAYEEPLIDLLVIDEAHYLRNRETSTSKLGLTGSPILVHLA